MSQRILDLLSEATVSMTFNEIFRNVQIQKDELIKILDNLVKENRLIEKNCGKLKIYGLSKKELRAKNKLEVKKNINEELKSVKTSSLEANDDQLTGNPNTENQNQKKAKNRNKLKLQTKISSSEVDDDEDFLIATKKPEKFTKKENSKTKTVQVTTNNQKLIEEKDKKIKEPVEATTNEKSNLKKYIGNEILETKQDTNTETFLETNESSSKKRHIEATPEDKSNNKKKITETVLKKTKNDNLKQENKIKTEIEQNQKLEDLKKRKEFLEEDIKQLQLKLSQHSVDKLKKNHDSEYEKILKEYKKRKRLCMEMIDAIFENYPKSKKHLFKEIGLETDEDVSFVLE